MADNDDSRLLETAYSQMAADEAREAEALAWAEATIGDVSDKALSEPDRPLVRCGYEASRARY
jgi:hypothetical protein